MNLLEFIPGYTSAIYNSGRQGALIMLVAFIITFILTRGYTRIARITGWGSASVGGVHAHHLVFGLVIAFLGGAAQFAFAPETNSWANILFAAMFGVGAALVLDEFALIFHLQDVYWEDEGRKSVDAVVLGVAFGAIFLLHSTPFGSSSEDLSRTALTIIQIINICFVIIAALKGKIFFAIFGIFIPLLAIVAAIRLAEPDSVWAKKFYKVKNKKLARSKKRYAHYNAVWRVRKEWAWDVIGGKTGRPPIKKKS